MEIRYYGDKISERIAKTPEGFLICQDVPISRTGYQEYLASELMDNPINKHKIIPVYRPAKEVFDPRSLASFEGKPVTNEHPDEDVTPENYQRYSCGHVQNVHVGVGEDSNKVLADLYITDPTLIRLIEDGKREISCGYYAEEKKDDTGKICQIKIRGNHVAVVRNGRAGKTVCIRDKHPYKGKRFRRNNRFERGGYLQGDERMRYYDEDYLTDEDEILEDEDYLEDDDIIVEDEDYLEDEDELLEDDDDIIVEDEDYLEDEDELLEDEDEFVEDEDYLDTFYKDYGVKGMKKGEHVKARDPEYVEALKGGGGKKGMSTGKKVALGLGTAAAGVGAALAGRKIHQAMKLGKALGYSNKQAAGMIAKGLGSSAKAAAGRGVHSAARGLGHGIGSGINAGRAVASGAKRVGGAAASVAKRAGGAVASGAKAAGRGVASGANKALGFVSPRWKYRGLDSRYWDRCLPYYDDDELLLNDDELILEDEDILEDDDMLLEDDDMILEDDDMLLEDEDEFVEDEDELVEDEDEGDLNEQAASVLRDAKRTLRDARAQLKRMKMRDAIILNDNDLEEDDEEELLQDDEDVIVEDEDYLEDEDELTEDDEDIMVEDEDEFVEDEDELTEDDEDVIVEDGCHNDEDEAIDTDKTQALREITEASRGITDPNERKQLQDAIYKALCGRNQMQDVMRITKRNMKSRMDSAAKKNSKVDLTQQQSIYDSLNPHKKTSF